ncbi:MAG: hypothetical protein P8J87_06465 [Verrucomicrobiales bacterium]|nr:hypothetical protein [Verrucomicrobiales bacterium]
MQVPPELDLTSLSPAAGWQTKEKITVTGDFTDDRGFRYVEYRIRGRGDWKNASFTTSGTVASGTITATFTINLKLKRKQYTRIEIRAVDVDGNESDYITRRYRWDRYGFVVRDGATTNTGTNTGTDSGTDIDIGTDIGTDIGGTDPGNNTTDASGIIQQFTISPGGAFEPTAVTLTWSAPDAATVVIDQDIGDVANSGTLDVGVLSTTKTFTLTATSGDGTKASLSRTILIRDNPFPF